VYTYDVFYSKYKCAKYPIVFLAGDNDESFARITIVVTPLRRVRKSSRIEHKCTENNARFHSIWFREQIGNTDWHSTRLCAHYVRTYKLIEETNVSVISNGEIELLMQSVQIVRSFFLSSSTRLFTWKWDLSRELILPSGVHHLVDLFVCLLLFLCFIRRDHLPTSVTWRNVLYGWTIIIII